MKQITALAAALLLTISAFAQEGKNIYMKYSDADDVSAVYISPAMFRLMGKIPDIDVNGEGVNLGKIIKSLSGFYLLNTSNPKVTDSLVGETRKLITKGKYEILMEAKENGETVRIYTVGDDKTVTGFVLFSNHKEESTFIYLDGEMPREELEQMIAGAASRE